MTPLDTLAAISEQSQRAVHWGACHYRGEELSARIARAEYQAGDDVSRLLGDLLFARPASYEVQSDEASQVRLTAKQAARILGALTLALAHTLDSPSTSDSAAVYAALSLAIAEMTGVDG